MKLTEKDYQQFLELSQSLFLYVGQKEKIFEKDLTLEKLRKMKSGQLFLDCSNAFCEKPSLLDDFLSENPNNMEEESLAIISEFRHFVKGDFFIYKYLKDYTVFIKDKNVYGVYGLSDPIERFFGNNLPTLVETVLLPFKGKITFHGFFLGGRIRFGSTYKRSFNEIYKQAKVKYGIITSLPHDGDTIYAKQSPSDQLAYFMKTKVNREEFEREIVDILGKHPELYPQYWQKRGGLAAVDYKKQFKNIGLNKAYYAILQDQIIASALKKKELQTQIEQLVPARKQDWVYIFKM